MSLVTEILSAAESAEIENLNRKIPEIVGKIEKHKQDVTTYIENVYMKYSEPLRHNKVLLHKADQLNTEIVKLKTNLEDITRSEINAGLKKLSAYKNNLIESNCALKISSQLIDIHEKLLNIEVLQNEKEYVKAVIEIDNTNKIFTSLDDDHVDVLEELAVNVRTTQQILINKISNTFKDNIQFLEKPPFTLKISKNREQMSQLLQAFALYKSTIKPLDNVTKFLWNCVFYPIVCFKTQVDIGEVDDIYILTIQVLSETEKNTYEEVFHNLIQVLDFLNSYFKYTLLDSITTLSYIGNDLRDNLTELIIKQCLNDTIPSTSQELPSYKVVIEGTETLQKKLIECEIFAIETSSILDHANNVDVHFINKKCQEYLSTATTIMKKDLHDMIEVGTPHDANNPLAEVTATFPQCCVSKSCIELIQLLEKMIKKAIVSSDICAGRLFCTVQNILHIYGNVVQEYHQKLLQTIPQQVGLFHNNCMYLSHQLVEWNETYKQKFPGTLCTAAAAFSDKAYLLKSVGNTVFLDCIQQQVKQLEEILKDIDFASTLPGTEKCIRQCLRQQELLKTVWHKILSYVDYNQSIGYILNFVCNYITNAIIKVEDISAAAAEQLVDVFKIILARGPKLFSDPKEINLYVNNWYKMSELVFILNSSLVDIEDRWADGKGPIALQFQPEEVKKLIRALFENTDRRSAVLAKISVGRS